MKLKYSKFAPTKNSWTNGVNTWTPGQGKYLNVWQVCLVHDKFRAGENFGDCGHVFYFPKAKLGE